MPPILAGVSAIATSPFAILSLVPIFAIGLTFVRYQNYDPEAHVRDIGIVSTTFFSTNVKFDVWHLKMNTSENVLKHRTSKGTSSGDGVEVEEFIQDGSESEDDKLKLTLMEQVYLLALKDKEGNLTLLTPHKLSTDSPPSF